MCLLSTLTNMLERELLHKSREREICSSYVSLSDEGRPVVCSVAGGVGGGFERVVGAVDFVAPFEATFLDAG